MPVHIPREPDALQVVFDRDGEEPETQVVIGLSDPVRAGERALLYAIAMLAQRRRLQIGDRNKSSGINWMMRIA